MTFYRYVTRNSLYLNNHSSHFFKHNYLTSSQLFVKTRNFHTSNEIFEEDLKWSDPDGLMKVLHDYNHVRIPFIIKSLLSENGKDQYLKYLKRKQSNGANLILHGLKILEVGCGGGILSKQLARLGAKVIAIDTSNNAIIYANKQLNEINSQNHDKLDIKYICNNVQNFTNSWDKSSKFSLIVCSEVLEHMSMEEKLSFFSNSNELLSDDGILIITCPSKSLFSFFTNIFLAENLLHMVPKGTHDFSLFLSYRELIDIANKFGFEQINSQGLVYIPFYRKFIPVNSKSQLYMVALKKSKGQLL